MLLLVVLKGCDGLTTVLKGCDGLLTTLLAALVSCGVVRGAPRGST